MAKPRTVVVAIDESDHSEYAFNFYVDNVHRKGDRIVLVHVPEFNNLLSASSLLTDPKIVADMLRGTEEKTRQLAQKYSLKMKQWNISGHVKQLCGKPGEAVIEAIRQEQATMLIIGTRGMGMFRRTFTGSVSDYCIHHADIPVLVCRHKTTKQAKEDN